MTVFRYLQHIVSRRRKDDPWMMSFLASPAACLSCERTLHGQKYADMNVTNMWTAFASMCINLPIVWDQDSKVMHRCWVISLGSQSVSPFFQIVWTGDRGSGLAAGTVMFFHIKMSSNSCKKNKQPPDSNYTPVHILLLKQCNWETYQTWIMKK